MASEETHNGNTDTIDARSRRGKVLRGTVVKRAMRDTITVAVVNYTKHPKYKKYVRRTKKYLVHDPKHEVQTGDIVSIRETRPISKRKSFMIA